MENTIELLFYDEMVCRSIQALGYETTDDALLAKLDTNPGCETRKFIYFSGYPINKKNEFNRYRCL